MTVSLDRFHQLAAAFGALLTVMGLLVLGIFGVYVVAGVDLLGPTVGLGGPGMVVFASLGAFLLPLGASLFGRDVRTSSRLRSAGGALGLMALLRLAAFVDPGLRAALGAAPLVEFVALGGLAAFALLLRPELEAPVELLHTFEIPASAEAVWGLVGERFADVASYASGVRESTMDGPLEEGAVRVCHSEPFGPFPSSRITEELVEFHPAAMRLAYVAGGELPAFIPASRNRWWVERVDAERSRLSSHASLELTWWALPAAPLVGRLVRPAILAFGRDVTARLRVIEGAVAPS